jgi:hypothetical protein
MRCAKHQQLQTTRNNKNFTEKTMEKTEKWEANKPVIPPYFFFAAFFLVFLAPLATILTSKP